ncbi:IS4 family transposase [Streptomyces sp. NPDC006365]|uniref:IS4 family transposase n=1 Tax=Streptomyces sp. NPDC006365 TaxID=3364744 RepID=UPI003674E262
MDRCEHVVADQGPAAAGLAGHARTVPGGGPAAGNGHGRLPGAECAGPGRNAAGRAGLARQPGRLRQVRLPARPGPAGYPQARVVTVADCSTHAVLDAVIGGVEDSERVVSDELEARIGTGTLVLADRGLWGLARWHRLRGHGAHLLFRIERRKARRVEEVLPDGGYLACIGAHKHSKASKTVKAPPALVRVIEYRVEGQADVIRLITSLTDHERYPAAELAALYARRWEIELVFDEIKTHQRGRPVLCSQIPGGVRQEIYARLVVHRATRGLLNEAGRLYWWVWAGR